MTGLSTAENADSWRDMFSVLSHNVWFGDFPNLEDIARISRRRSLADGDLVTLRGANPEGMCIVLRGAIRSSTVGPDGREIVTLVKPGDLWGIVAVLDGCGAVHHSIARGETEVIVIPSVPLHRLLDTHPILHRYFNRILCYRLRKAYSSIEDIGLASLRQRIARQLCILWQLDKPAVGALHSPPVAVTQDELAALVGASRPRVNQELQNMQAEGLISVSYRGIAICRYEQLLETCISARLFEH